MKPKLKGLGLSAAFFLVSCGGGGGGSSAPPAPAPTPPGISNFAYTTTSSYPVGYGGGAVSIGWTFSFVDSGGDITTLVIEKLDGSGNVTKTGTVALSNMAGLTVGVIQAVGVADTTVAGTVNWRFHVVDAGGSASNSLTSSYTITPAAGAENLPAGEAAFLKDVTITQH